MKTTINEVTRLLIGRLWGINLKRVPYAKKYAEMVTEKGGRVIHDHIAFRTINAHTGEQPEGISAIAHIIRELGYKKAGSYTFSRMKLSACHFEHPDPELPKIFVSQLETNQFPEWFSDLIHEKVVDTPYLFSDQGIELLNLLKGAGTLPFEAGEILINALTGYFCRPWEKISREDVLKINDVSQYAAWTLLHGNSVNHFAALVNFQEVPEWSDLESTCNALMEVGIPMKSTIEGEKGSKLRQSATHAVIEEVEVSDEEGETDKIEWPYAYYEFVERGNIDENVEMKLFSGFLADQAVHLFNMTRLGE
jgi:hypothetical protein